MARSRTNAAAARSNGHARSVPTIAIEDEALFAEEQRNLARVSRDRATGRFVPLAEALDVARRGRTLGRPGSPHRPGR